MSTITSVPAPPPLESQSARSPQSQGSLALLAIFVGVIVAAHAPLLVIHGMHLWQKPHYQFFPLVIAGSAFLAWTRLQGIGRLEPGSPYWCYPLVLVLILMLAVASIMGSPWIGAVTAICALAVGTYGIGGTKLLARMLPAWTLLWLAVPFPNNLDRTLITSLQLFTARWSSVVLDMLGVVHVMEGAVVEVPQKKLLVEEACSGIHSLFATLCVTLFWVFWSRTPALRAIPLLVSAIFWVVVANVARVVIVTVVDTQLGINVTEGTPHEILSLVVFAVILGLVFSTDRLLLFLIPSRLWKRKSAEARAEDAAAEPRLAIPDVRRTWLGSAPVMLVYAALAAFQLMIFWPGQAEALLITEMGPEGMPKVCIGCPQVEYDMTTREIDANDEGKHSQRWTYQLGRNTAIVSLDYPFHGWHELTVCYRNNGWELLDSAQKVLDDGTPSGGSRVYIEASMRKSLDTHGFLLFSVYDREGKNVDPVTTEFVRRFVRGAVGLNRFLKMTGANITVADDLTSSTYQIQVLVQSYAPLTEAEKAQARGIFREAEARLRQRIASGEDDA